MAFILDDKPLWYTSRSFEETFTCRETRGLLQRVYTMMSDGFEGMGYVKHYYNPQTVQKMIRDFVIDNVHLIHQEPSRPLLLALMDIIDVCGNIGNYASSNDKAGVREEQLTDGNYTLYCINEKQLNKVRDNKDNGCINGCVIPIATYYHNEKDLVFYDGERSMLGTYVVDISKNKHETKEYFVQQVLYVPGPKSLELLQSIVGGAIEFWDMALEVPTHPHALAPAFTQATLAEVLLTAESTTDQPDDLPTANATTPMCCIYDTVSLAQNTSRRETSIDCLDENQIIQDVSHFKCARSITKTVYFRRGGRITQGKRTHLLLVVRDNIEKDGNALKYISTTARFCRALTHSCEKGNGTLLECCTSTLKELGSRATYLTGDEIFPDIHLPALAAFVKRVSKDNQQYRWCVYTPRYFSKLTTEPYMADVIELGVKLLDAKIPNAFVVAELMYCPFEKVQDYADFLSSYDEQKEAVNTIAAANIVKQMKNAWRLLITTAEGYITARYGQSLRSETMRMFDNNVMSAQSVQKTWQTHIKHDSDRDARNNKELCQLYNTTKVLFHNIKVYHARLTKLTNKDSQTTNKTSGASSPPRFVEKQPLATQLAKKNKKTSPCFVVPDQQPLATWLKGLGVLLTSSAWLYRGEGEQKQRRDLVCDVLGINTKNARHVEQLQQWVELNKTTVEQLSHNELQDKLSTTLTCHLDKISVHVWLLSARLALRLSCDTSNRTHENAPRGVCWDRRVSGGEQKPDDCPPYNPCVDVVFDRRVLAEENLTADETDNEYDVTDGFIDDSYVDDQYSHDSEYDDMLMTTVHPTTAVKKRKRIRVVQPLEDTDTEGEASTTKRGRENTAESPTTKHYKRSKDRKEKKKKNRHSKKDQPQQSSIGGSPSSPVAAAAFQAICGPTIGGKKKKSKSPSAPAELKKQHKKKKSTTPAADEPKDGDKTTPPNPTAAESTTVLERSIYHRPADTGAYQDPDEYCFSEEEESSQGGAPSAPTGSSSRSVYM